MDKQIILQSLENVVKTASSAGFTSYDVLSKVAESLPENDDACLVATGDTVWMRNLSYASIGTLIEKLLFM